MTDTQLHRCPQCAGETIERGYCSPRCRISAAHGSLGADMWDRSDQLIAAGVLISRAVAPDGSWSFELPPRDDGGVQLVHRRTAVEAADWITAYALGAEAGGRVAESRWRDAIIIAAHAIAQAADALNRPPVPLRRLPLIAELQDAADDLAAHLA